MVLIDNNTLIYQLVTRYILMNIDDFSKKTNPHLKAFLYKKSEAIGLHFHLQKIF